MGVVLKARDPSLERIVAVKVMAPHLASSGSACQRFARESKAAAAILHPNVIAIHSVYNDGPLPYLVMPYVRGESLQRRIDRKGPLPVSDVLRIGIQIAAGLSEAHKQGMVHRDIKPANILLEEGIERVGITDFGLARAIDDASMTQSGVLAGTPQYMSPEQARGEAIGARSDLFSLGSVLYTMCTGHSPFRAETSFGVLHRITHESPRDIREINPNIPRWLCKLVAMLHEPLVQHRAESADFVESTLTQCLAHVEQPDRNPLPKLLQENEPSDPVKRGFWLVSSIACLALIVWFLPWNQGPQSEQSPSPQFTVIPPTMLHADQQSKSSPESASLDLGAEVSIDWEGEQTDIDVLLMDIDRLEAETISAFEFEFEFEQKQ